MKNLKELRKELTEMIVSSDVVINRREFRTMYFVYDISKQRKTKLLKLLNSDNSINEVKEFTECEYFMSITMKSDIYYVKFKRELYDNFYFQIEKQSQEWYLVYCDLRNYIEEYLLEQFSFDETKDFDIDYTRHSSITIKSFEHYNYKNQAEDRTLMFPFKKHKFDILNKYSYKQIVKLFKNV